MKALIVALVLVASLACVSETSAFGFGRRSAVVVNAPGVNVAVRGGGAFRRQQVVVNASPFVVRQRAVVVQPFVQHQFVQPFAVQSFGVPVYGVQSFGVQQFNGGCGAFFVR